MGMAFTGYFQEEYGDIGRSGEDFAVIHSESGNPDGNLGRTVWKFPVLEPSGAASSRRSATRPEKTPYCPQPGTLGDESLCRVQRILPVFLPRGRHAPVAPAVPGSVPGGTGGWRSALAGSPGNLEDREARYSRPRSETPPDPPAPLLSPSSP